MQQSILANRWILLSVFVFSALCIFFSSSCVTIKSYNDDGFYLSVFKSRDTINFLFKQYHEWSGRSAIDLLMISTIGIPVFWKIGIPVSISLTCFSCCRISGIRVGLLSWSVCAILFLLIPLEINNDASYWVTGFYNYLLPVSIALYVFSVVQSERISIIERWICVALSFYFPYMEQAALCFLVSAIILFILKKSAINMVSILITLIVTSNFIICIAAPGSTNRAFLESWNWFPQYQYYTYDLKFLLGIDKLNELIFLRGNIPFIALNIVLFSYRSTKGRMNISSIISMFVIIFYSITSILQICYPESSVFEILHTGIISGENFYNPFKYLSYIYMFVIFSSCIYLMIDMLFYDLSLSIPITALLVGMMSVAVLGFSPTVFASSFRVDYIFEICCIIITMFFLKNLAK